MIGYMYLITLKQMFLDSPGRCRDLSQEDDGCCCPHQRPEGRERQMDRTKQRIQGPDWQVRKAS